MNDFIHLAKENFSEEKGRFSIIDKGASGRVFIRVSKDENFSLSKEKSLQNSDDKIICIYKDDRPENLLYAKIAKFLKPIINVPEIFEEKNNMIIMSSAGDIDLLDYTKKCEDLSFIDLYKSVIKQIYNLHKIGFQKWEQNDFSPKLMEGFDENLYKWETSYFLTNVSKYFSLPNLLAKEENFIKDDFCKIRKILLSQKTCLIHRDLQSQNIMIKTNNLCDKNLKITFIDFQGLRKGCSFYDIASLLEDPYANLSLKHKNELFLYYLSLNENLSDLTSNYINEQFVILKYACLQRLMQACGAYCLFCLNGKGFYEKFVLSTLNRIKELSIELKTDFILDFVKKIEK